MKNLKRILSIIILSAIIGLSFEVPSQARSSLIELTKAEKSRYNDEINRIVAGINKSWSDEEKVFYVHDYLVKNVEYDNSYANHAGYDALIEKTAVCEGYSIAFCDICTKLGIPAVMVASNTMHHAWNAVKIRGKWYYVDCTWDDPTYYVNGQVVSSDGRCSHKNLLRNEAGLRKTGHKGNDWYICWKDGERLDIFYEIAPDECLVNGKYTDATYEKLDWHDSDAYFTFTNSGVIYQVVGWLTRHIYIYKCDAKAPVLVTEMSELLPYAEEELYDKDNFLSVDGNKIIIKAELRDFEYDIDTGTMKTTRCDVYEDKDGSFQAEGITAAGTGSVFINSSDQWLYYNKNNGKRPEKILELRPLTQICKGCGVNPTRILKGKGNILTITLPDYNNNGDDAVWEYNLVTGDFKLKTGSAYAKQVTAEYLKSLNNSNTTKKNETGDKNTVTETSGSKKTEDKNTSTNTSGSKKTEDKNTSTNTSGSKTQTADKNTTADTSGSKKETTKKKTNKPLKKGSKFTVNGVTYKVTGTKKVSVTKITGTKVTIPDTAKYKNIKYTVESIGDKAAYKGKVKTLVIGKNVKKIGKNAFYKCPATKITVNSKVLKSVGKNAFAIKGKATVKVQKKYLKKYTKLLKNAGLTKKSIVK